MVTKKPDFVFECYKCSHQLYVDKTKVEKLFKTDCPNCGEEAGQLWTLIGEGNYDKEHG